jgi:hypothetical protein
LRLQTAADEPAARVPVRVAPRLAALLVRELLTYAVAATPRGSGVSVHVLGAEATGASAHGPRVVVDDAGTTLPASARRALVALEVVPGTFGRPSSVPLFVAAELAAAQGAQLDLADSPAQQAPPSTKGPEAPSEPRVIGGGVRAIVTFPAS